MLDAERNTHGEAGSDPTRGGWAAYCFVDPPEREKVAERNGQVVIRDAAVREHIGQKRNQRGREQARAVTVMAAREREGERSEQERT